jgi:RHS repeat-associated protein
MNTNGPVNILTTISDRKKRLAGATPAFEAVIETAQDYYPFGSLMPGRKYNAGEYRFGFNGMEKDDEITGITGSHNTTEFRGYDSRLGKWLSVDPLASSFPWQSPFTALDNNPIRFVDPDGRSAGDFLNKEGKKVGSDGKADGKLYVIKTTQTSFESGVPSAGITEAESTSTEDFIRLNSGNAEEFIKNDIAYKNSIEIEGNIITRSKMYGHISLDDGSHGTAPQNNREYFGKIGFFGEIHSKGAGTAVDPVTSSGADSPFIVDRINYKSRYHSHPSGERIDPLTGVPRKFIQPPSPTDVKNAGHRIN